MSEEIPELEIGQRFRFKFGDPRFLFELRKVTVTDGTDFEMTGAVIELSSQDFIDADGRVITEPTAITEGPTDPGSPIRRSPYRSSHQ